MKLFLLFIFNLIWLESYQGSNFQECWPSFEHYLMSLKGTFGIFIILSSVSDDLLFQILRSGLFWRRQNLVFPTERFVKFIDGTINLAVGNSSFNISSKMKQKNEQYLNSCFHSIGFNLLTAQPQQLVPKYSSTISILTLAQPEILRLWYIVYMAQHFASFVWSDCFPHLSGCW